MTAIEKELLSLGFKHLHGTDYTLDVYFPYPGVRLIHASLMPKGWMFYYEVDQMAASRIYKTIDEVKVLYKILTGNELIKKVTPNGI